MDIISRILLSSHVIAGFVALVLFWIPVMTRKGGINHRKIGMWYVWAMSFVVLSALILSIENLIKGQLNLAIFLGFLTLITARPLWLGIECLNSKKEVKTKFRVIHLSSSVVVAFAGAGMLAYGLSISSDWAILMIIFGILGLTAVNDAYALLKSGSNRVYKQWLDDHIANMCASGIAAHTAFLVFGARSFLANVDSAAFSIAVWVAPSIIGLVAAEYAKRRFGSKSVASTRKSITAH